MTVLLQVSDPHFGTQRGEVMSALTQLFELRQPDLLVVSGDITQRATTSQFEQARVFIESLGVPNLLTIPGNHDIPLFNLVARLAWPYRAYRKSFGKNLEPAIEMPNLTVVGVDGTRRFRHVNGQVSAAQRDRVSERLRSAPASSWRVVVTHQPLAVPGRDESRNLMRGHRRAVNDWIRAGADVFLGGHIHLPYLRPLRGHQGRRAWCFQAGTAISSRTRGPEPNSVNLLSTPVRGDAGLCLAERWDYDTLRSCFRLRASWLMRADRGAG